MYNLCQLASTKNLAVVITNHSTDGPNNDRIASPYGGKVMPYVSNYIINLTRGSKMPGSINAVLKEPY
jgi:hypothetical protein